MTARRHNTATEIGLVPVKGGILLLQSLFEFLGMLASTGLTNNVHAHFVDIVLHRGPVLVKLLDAESQRVNKLISRLV